MREYLLEAADIVHFDQYFYTDREGGSKNRFSVVVLPSTLSRFQSSIYCCVVTKQSPNKWNCHISLKKTSYRFLSMDSFCCFDRMDMQSRGDLSDIEQPLGKLLKDDIKAGLKQIARFLYRSNSGVDGYLRAAIIREWKQTLQKSV